MDALKIISEGSIKAEKPQFNVGDTVPALTFASRKASVSVSRLSRAPLLLKARRRCRDLYRSPRFLRCRR